MSFNGFIKRNIYWISDFFKGRKVRKHFSSLKKELRDADIGQVEQRKKLKALLHYATTYSDFYKNLGEDLQAFPVVNKNILNENYEKVVIPTQFIPEQETQRIHIQKTSGSTGTPFCVPQDSRKRHRRVAELKYFGEDVGFKSHERLGQCRIWTKWHTKSKKQIFWENIIPININKMDDEALSNLCAVVKKEKIVSLRAYASWYDKIVEYFERGKGDPKDFKKIKVAISISEALNEETRRKMYDLVKVPIVECYADEEGGVLAQQKVGDINYYLNHSSYYFEFLKLDCDEPAEYGELARIVFTDLYNYAFPLIRYDTGDLGILQCGKDNSKACGWDYMSKLYGRRLDLVYDVAGNPIHPMTFARVLKNIEGIIQWQFIQRDEKIYALKLNMDSTIDLGKLITEIKNIVGKESIISIEKVEEIPVLASGKRKPVVCEWKKSHKA